jgi:hypothetical protein
MDVAASFKEEAAMSDQRDGPPSTNQHLAGQEEQVSDDPNQPGVEPTASAQASVERPSAAQQAAELAVDTLTAAEQQALPAAVVQTLDSPDHQKAAAEAVVGALPTETRQDLATTVLQNLDTPQQQRAAAEAVMGALPTEQREQIAEGVLGRPDRSTRRNLWYIVIWTMAAAIFVFGSMAFVLIYQGKAAEAPLALATTALGGVVGLVATSPGSGRSG